jgi:hypothetical protein
MIFSVTDRECPTLGHADALLWFRRVFGRLYSYSSIGDMKQALIVVSFRK